MPCSLKWTPTWAPWRAVPQTGTTNTPALHHSRRVQDWSQSLKAPEPKSVCHTLKPGDLFSPDEVIFDFYFIFYNTYRTGNYSLCFPGWWWEFYVWVLFAYLLVHPKWKVQQDHVTRTLKKRRFPTSLILQCNQELFSQALSETIPIPFTINWDYFFPWKKKCGSWIGSATLKKKKPYYINLCLFSCVKLNLK